MTAPPHAAEAAAPALDIAHLRKSFGGAVALEDFSLQVRKGEIHALLGQNGCGKSTLVKALTGVIAPDGGSVTLFGRRLEFPVRSPGAQGIAVIHQDIGIVGEMTVFENLGVVSNYGAGLLAPIRRGRERAIYKALMQELDIALDLDAPASRLSPAEQTFLGVIRALRLAQAAGTEHLFILDEPTATLSKPEADKVLGLMRRLADRGTAVIFISHRMSEVFAVCDRVSVMRSGRDIAHQTVASVTRDDLLTQMLGRRLGDMFPAPPAQPLGQPRLSLRGLSGQVLQEAQFDLHAGEVLGLAGLAGMGQEEVPLLVSGAAMPRGGAMALDGRAVRFASPAEAIAAGVVLVPRNRLRDGVWLAGTAQENLSLPVLPQNFRRGRLRHGLLQADARTKMAGVSVHPPRPDYPIAAFSGGNQQKVVFAKWLQMNPRVLVLDEPTQGVDPGAARQLLDHAMAAAAGGAAVLILSGDFELLAAVCHRVLTVQNGIVTSELARHELSEAAIMAACDTVQRGAAAV